MQRLHVLAFVIIEIKPWILLQVPEQIKEWQKHIELFILLKPSLKMANY